MRLLFIICEASVDEKVEELLTRVGAAGFTRFTGAIGRGRNGPREGTSVWPGLNSLLMVGVPDEIVPDILEAIEQLSSERGGRLAVKVFSVPADEHC